MAIDQNELRESAQQDKNFAAQLAKATTEKLSRPFITLTGDITGSPSEAAAFHRYKLGEQLALQGVQRSLFFARVDVTRDSKWAKGERVAMLVTKVRTSIGVDGDGWEVLSWTAPITSDLLDKPIGSRSEFQAKGQKPVQYVVDTSAKFEEIAPTIRNAKYLLRSGEAFVESEEQLLDQLAAPPSTRPKRRYEAQRAFGLSEIIVLADAPQRAAMHLPFRESVLIEGPPGSGKTSIGIMRIPCLIDRQWDELGLDRMRSDAFHSNNTMRILVLNDEMVGYLDSLVRSLGIDGVPVQTVRSFLRAICRDARTLSGRETRERGASAYVKAHPSAVAAYWAGCKRHLGAIFAAENDEVTAPLLALGDHGKAVFDELRNWAKELQRIEVEQGAVPDSVNLAARIDDWIVRAARIERRPTRDPAQEDAARNERESRLRDTLRELWPRLFGWVSVVKAMFKTREYSALIEACQTDGLSADDVVAADKAWREQSIAEQPQFSEYDAVLAAWLGAHVALAPWTDRPALVAPRTERFTHVLIDEAQDLWPAHLRVIERLLAPGGNVTLVGDLRQRLRDTSGLGAWSDLGIRELRLAAFSVNYRQSRQIGGFVHALYRRLYDEVPVWKPSEERDGAIARVCEARPRRFAAVAAEEVRMWRKEIPQATVGVIYDGRWSTEKLTRFRDQLETALQDTLTEVHLATRGAGSAVLRRTDCVIVVSAAATKGLEFDAVVFIDPSDAWEKELDAVPIRRRNGLYVAVSRARQGLSVVMRIAPAFLRELGESGLCEVAQSYGDD